MSRCIVGRQLATVAQFERAIVEGEQAPPGIPIDARPGRKEVREAYALSASLWERLLAGHDARCSMCRAHQRKKQAELSKYQAILEAK